MRNLFVTACIAAAFFVSSATVPALAGGEPKRTKLLNTTLGDIEREVNIVVAEFEPGAETPRHLHPGNLFVYVLEGTLEVHVEGEEPQMISAGEVFQEVPDKPMVGRNVSASEGAKVIIFQIGEVGKPLTVAQPK